MDEPLLGPVLDVVRPALDIVRARVTSGEPPEWCRVRGWSEFLLGLSEPELECAEERGLRALPELEQRMPASLRAWLDEVGRATRVPRLGYASPEPPAWRGVNARKREQLRAMLDAVAPLARHARQIVDFGSGSGHFARLAAGTFDAAVLGLERSAERVARAEQRVAQAALPRLRYEHRDVGERPFALGEGSLAFGLHACGELGDRLIRAAAAADSDVVLISCCAQKISSARREPLSLACAELVLEREVLGLSNLSARAEGVESSLRDALSARMRRHALAVLFRLSGVELGLGEELRGVNRRRAHDDFARLAELAFAARGLRPPRPDVLAEATRLAQLEFGRVRRLSLPRNALSRLLELAIVLDRAHALREAGLEVRVLEVFEPEITPRNLGLFASRDSARLAACVSAA